MAARRKPPRFRAREADPRLAEEVARLRAENEQLRRQQAYSDLSDAASSFNSRTSLSRSYDQELADLRGSNERLLAEQRSLARTVQELRDAAVATPSPPRRPAAAQPSYSVPVRRTEQDDLLESFAADRAKQRRAGPPPGG